MKISSLKEVKEELLQLEPDQMAELCLKLAKYKKDNKEYLGYLLFQANDELGFIEEIKKDIDEHFAEMSKQKNLYYIKKSLRKLLRVITKYGRYLNEKKYTIQLHIYFCKKIMKNVIPIHKSTRLENLYAGQIKKINTLLGSLHEDLQSDYKAEIESIELYLVAHD